MLYPENFMINTMYSKTDFEFWIPNKTVRMIRRLKKCSTNHTNKKLKEWEHK